MESFSDKKVLIVGLSVTGIACARYLSKYAEVYLTECREKRIEDTKDIKELQGLGVKIEFGAHSKEFINNAQFAIISPSIPRDADILKKLEEKNIEYFSDIEFVHRVIQNKPQMILVTGTNGKTTTTLLMSHIFSKKFNAPACGNVGVPPVVHLDKNSDYLVIEASSYQLNYSKKLSPKIAVFTNLTPDHLSWHGGEEEYFEAKAGVFKRMDKNSHSILNFDDKKVRTLADDLRSQVHFFALNKSDLADRQGNCYVDSGSLYWENEKIIDIKDIPIVGNHNLQNVMCCVIAAKIEGIETRVICDSIKSFTAPAHRCEFVRMLGETAYYNDSKATNPEAAIVAINSFEGQKVVLIAGGRDKNTSLDEFVESVKDRISKVVLIGEATARFMNELYINGYTNIVHAHSLEEAIDLASLDKPDTVLLSPACASFDMFKNYEERGEAFRRYVLSKKQLVS